VPTLYDELTPWCWPSGRLFPQLRVAPQRKAMWLFLITIPFWTSYLIRVFLWKVILGYNGVINSGAEIAGHHRQPLNFILYNVNSDRHHAGPCLCALRDPADLHRAGKDRPLAAGGRADLGESRCDDLLAGDAAPGDAGRDRGGR
jgi:spermidine/putrescine transport system permease protein